MRLTGLSLFTQTKTVLEQAKSNLRNLLLTSLILLGSLIAVSGCANYEDKLVDDAKSSFDISKSKAECLVTAILNRTGWDAERAWDVLKEKIQPLGQ
mgnify:CR=1 FL=1